MNELLPDSFHYIDANNLYRHNNILAFHNSAVNEGGNLECDWSKTSRDILRIPQ